MFSAPFFPPHPFHYGFGGSLPPSQMPLMNGSPARDRRRSIFEAQFSESSIPPSLSLSRSLREIYRNRIRRPFFLAKVDAIINISREKKKFGLLGKATGAPFFLFLSIFNFRAINAIDMKHESRAHVRGSRTARFLLPPPPSNRSNSNRFPLKLPKKKA